MSFSFVNVVEQSDQKNESDRDGNLIQMNHTHAGPIELAPGESVTVKVDVPAYVDVAASIDALGDAGVSKLMQGAMQFIQKVTTKPEDVKFYEITVWAHVDGVKKPKGAHRRILNQKSQGFKMRTKIAGVDIN